MAELSCVTAAAKIRSGELSPLDLVKTCLRRIEQLESQIHAWVLVDDAGAIADAVRLGDELRRGEDRGPLHGLPIGIKDIIDVQGWPTLAGSPLRRGHRAESDAPLVTQLREAGAIILGKTVTTEFAGFDPPPTRNPWNVDHTPGGSSSGSAAAVATGMCLAAIGSQTGGSITRPASFCGVAGCKPTWGEVSLEGIVPISYHLDHPGPIARTARDLAIVFQAIADPAPLSLVPQQPDETDLPHTNIVSPRLGLVTTFFMSECSETVKAATTVAVTRLQNGGARIETTDLPTSFADVHRLHRRIMAVDYAEYHRRAFAEQPKQFGREMTKVISEGLAATGVEMSEALRHQRRFRADMLAAIGDYDALVTPATVTTAPGPETTGDARFNSPWSYAGFPTVSLPCGVTPEGLPAAIQLVGRPGATRRLLDIAAWCEEHLGFNAVPPVLSKLV
jgi:aspartyl-tRNA(Asn)/glutamyl-tRNA(Gln) amidotransferase subunit A